MLTPLTTNNIDSALADKPYALILFDAEWNKHKDLTEQFRRIAAEYPGNDFIFAEIDVDQQPEISAKFGLMNVPAICYLYHGQPVKTVMGTSQNIKEQVRWFLQDCQNGWF